MELSRVASVRSTMERPSTGLLLIGATIVSLIVLGLATYLYARW